MAMRAEAQPCSALHALGSVGHHLNDDALPYQLIKPAAVKDTDGAVAVLDAHEFPVIATVPQVQVPQDFNHHDSLAPVTPVFSDPS